MIEAIQAMADLIADSPQLGEEELKKRVLRTRFRVLLAASALRRAWGECLTADKPSLWSRGEVQAWRAFWATPALPICAQLDRDVQRLVQVLDAALLLLPYN